MQLPKILTDPHPLLRKKARNIPEKEISSKPLQELIETMKEVLKNSEDGVGLAAPQIGESVRLFLVSEEAEALDKNPRYHPPTTELRGEQESGMKNQDNAKNKEGPLWKYHVFINPVITRQSAKKMDMAEGCLSVPGIYGIVRRPEKVSVEWLDENGIKHSRGFSKFFARVIQHEVDHLDGILFIDKMHTKVALNDGQSKL